MSARSRIERPGRPPRSVATTPLERACVSISSGSASSRSSTFPHVFGSSSPSSGSLWMARRSSTRSGSSSLASSSRRSRSLMAPPSRQHGRAARSLEASGTVQPLAARIDALAETKAGGIAFFSDSEDLTWRDYARRSDRLAARLAALCLVPGERVAGLLPDGPGVHVAFVGCEKAGLVVMGIGPRAGAEEIRHLVRKSWAAALVTRPASREHDFRALFEALRGEGATLRHHVVVERQLDLDEACYTNGPAAPPDLAARRLGASDLFLLNSTSGTTGLPKCVMHHQARWFHFHDEAVASGELGATDVFCSVLPAPFGFGLWTAHFTPATLGAPCVVLERFTSEETLRRIERHRVTVLAGVSTQFILLLEDPTLPKHD